MTSYQSHHPKVSSTAPKCPVCGKSVYFAEKVTALDKDWHKACFKCDSCKKTLETGQYAERDNKPYCKRCYAANFKPQGFGFGSLGGYTGVGAGASGEVVASSQTNPFPQNNQ